MSITPIDILNKQFDQKLRGYDRDQVNNFLDVIVANFEKLIDENKQLTQQLATTREKLAYYEELQESLNSSILIAQEAADRLKNNARQEAELILYEAEKMADNRLNDLSDEAKLMMNEIEALRITGDSYRQKIEEILAAQLDAVREDYLVNLFNHNKYTEKAEAYFENTQRRLQEVERLSDEVDEQYPLPELPEKPASVIEYEQSLAEESQPQKSPSVPNQAPTPQARPNPNEIILEEETLIVDPEPEIIIDEPVVIEPQPEPVIDNDQEVSNNETINGHSIRFELPKD